MIIIKVFVLFGLYSLTQSQNRFMPNLPLGEYRVVYNKIYHCESTINHPLQINLYFNKRTLSITELKGNFTFLIPFDDTLSFDMNFASWGSTGGWIPNSYILTKQKACSTIRNIFGNVWFTLIKHFNVQNDSCPVPAGTYQTSGVDLKKFEDLNWPKVYFYGIYKVALRIQNDDDKDVGCVIVEFSLIRPWETPI